jgi:hypothetical protein
MTATPGLERVNLPYGWTPRPQRADVFAAERSGCLHHCLVVHRRWGKGLLLWNLLIKRPWERVGLHLYIGRPSAR